MLLIRIGNGLPPHAGCWDSNRPPQTTRSWLRSRSSPRSRRSTVARVRRAENRPRRSRAAAAPVALRALSAAVDSSTCVLISTRLLRELSRNPVSKKTLGRRSLEQQPCLCGAALRARTLQDDDGDDGRQDTAPATAPGTRPHKHEHIANVLLEGYSSNRCDPARAAARAAGDLPADLGADGSSTHGSVLM